MAALKVDILVEIKEKVKKKLDNLLNSFQDWALSILFFGMAIQRIFSRIGRTALDTFKNNFNNLISSNYDSGTDIGDLLDGIETERITVHLEQLSDPIT